MSLVSAAQLQLVAPRSDYIAIAPYLDRAAARCSIDTPRRLRHWLAQVSVETQRFTRLTEDLHYTAERLCAVWPRRFPTLASAAACAMNPPALAERVYGGRMGNTRPGDGARYIGRGGLMRTGKDGYLDAQAAFLEQGVVVDLIAKPELLATNPYAWDDAANFWMKRGLNVHADADDIVAITERVNGGLTGLDDRRRALLTIGAVFRD